ncbi:hypothetical protein BV898_16158 [Hypsibius exemplaris]|uniref:RRM domain-containing protein n=1 Tax=Hypsibius exemplaris TaxID=2072580 RepID=A0A9X6ND09_HYPEX|nr:hypothetical protein BV898_16158 [Hypsibius exemplaris]
MPSVMAANLGVWTNSNASATQHPLGLTHKDPLTSLGWTTDRETDRVGHFTSEAGGDVLKIDHSSRTSSMQQRSLPATSRPATTRRPAIRSDSQKVIEVRNRIFVGGLTEAINEDDLRGLFGRYGQINEVQIKARGGDQFRGFGFITFSRNAEAADALRDCLGEVHTLRGRKINVQAAFKRVDKVSVSPTPTPIAGPAGWMGGAPTPFGGGPGQLFPPTLPPLPLPVTFNPFYFGPPVLVNGMWLVGPGGPSAGGMPLPMGGGFMMPPLMEPDVMEWKPIPTAATPINSSALLGNDIINGGRSHCGGGGGAGAGEHGKLGESRMGSFGGDFQPIGTRSSATDTLNCGSHFTTQSLSAPWFLPN